MRTPSSRARRWWPSSPASWSTTTSSAAPCPTPASPARPRWWCPIRTPRSRRRRPAAGLPAVERRPGAAPLAVHRPRRSQMPGGRRAHAGHLDRQLRRAGGDAGDRRRRRDPRAARAVGPEHRHRLRHDGRPPDRDPRQPTARPGRHARHPGVAEGGSVRGVLRRLQPADRDARRHARASTPARISSGGA